MIIVTGTSGFVGRNLARSLSEERTQYHGIDRRFGGATHRCVDLSNMDAWPIEASSAQSVIHCAAHADVRRNWDSKMRHQVFTDNVQATVRVLDASARCTTIKTFVFVSTGAVYASCTDNSAEETWRCDATSPYAASKLAGEAYVQAYAERYGWSWYVVRPAACFGDGYVHGHVADFVTGARNGTIKALDDGTTPQSAVHVKDLTRVLFEFSKGLRPSGVYNVVERLWSWSNTVAVMRSIRPEMEFEVVPGNKKTAWIGASKGSMMSGLKLNGQRLGPVYDVEDGVREALVSLGWV